jgi:hypothetical protein
MPQTDIGQTNTTSLKTAQPDWSVDAETLDGVQDQKETEYQIPDWSTKFGYYKNIPELQAAIDAKATWTVGKGIKAEAEELFIIKLITGNGTDTFNTILENMIRTYHIAGDAYAEIIKNKRDMVVNLKPLDPSTVKIVANKEGRVIRYEQTTKGGKKHATKKFQPEEIFHLSRNRVGDEIHGQSMIDAVESIIQMRNEAMADFKTVLHRNVAPVVIWHLDTDDTTKINAFKAKVEDSRKDVENIFIPKGAVVPEVMSVAPNATMNPLPWIENLNNYFFQATGVPDIILGGSKALTEASSKIAYLAFQQTIEEEQLYIEEQVLSQLNLLITLEFPASLENELLSDKAKDGPMNVQPNETTAGVGQ